MATSNSMSVMPLWPFSRSLRMSLLRHGQLGGEVALDWLAHARLRVRAVEMDGVDVQMASTRSYPRGRDFAHVLGYVARASADDLTRLAEGRSPDELKTFEELLRHPDIRVGRQGMERFAEDWLRGRPGRRRVVTNAHGRPMQDRQLELLTEKSTMAIPLSADR